MLLRTARCRRNSAMWDALSANTGHLARAADQSRTIASSPVDDELQYCDACWRTRCGKTFLSAHAKRITEMESEIKPARQVLVTLDSSVGCLGGDIGAMSRTGGCRYWLFVWQLLALQYQVPVLRHDCLDRMIRRGRSSSLLLPRLVRLPVGEWSGAGVLRRDRLSGDSRIHARGVNDVSAPFRLGGF